MRVGTQIYGEHMREQQNMKGVFFSSRTCNGCVTFKGLKTLISKNGPFFLFNLAKFKGQI